MSLGNILDIQEEKTVGEEGEKLNKNGVHLVTDEDESEASVGGEQSSILDRLGMGIDDTLHTIFTAYGSTFLRF